MGELDLGRLLRLKGMVEAAASSVEQPDGSAAPALTGSYMRTRAEISSLLGGSGLEQEFANAFPEIEVVEGGHRHPRDAAAAGITDAPAARSAQVLLGQLAGWLDGLIAERTLDQRLRLEAEERVKQERRQSPGFRAD
jgi:hypothetical protein